MDDLSRARSEIFSPAIAEFAEADKLTALGAHLREEQSISEKSRHRGFLGEFLGESLGIFLSSTDVELVRRACHVDAAQSEREHVPTEVNIHVRSGIVPSHVLNVASAPSPPAPPGDFGGVDADEGSVLAREESDAHRRRRA